MRTATATAILLAALSLAPPAPARAQDQVLEAEAAETISLLPVTWSEDFRAEWHAKERELEEARLKKTAGIEESFAEDVQDLRDDLREDEDELREQLTKDLEELREEFREKRSEILSSDDAAEEKESDLSDLDDDYYDERDSLEARSREDLADLRREFDDAVAERARQRDQELRTLARDHRAEVERAAGSRDQALIRHRLDRLRTEALRNLLARDGVVPAGGPVIATEIMERLGNRVEFVEQAGEPAGGSHVALSVKARVGREALRLVAGQWGLLVPPAPIVLRFSGFKGNPKVPEQAVAALGLLDRAYTVRVEGGDVLIEGSAYLPAAKIAEGLNRVRVDGGEVRAEVGEAGLTVTPFP